MSGRSLEAADDGVKLLVKASSPAKTISGAYT